MLIQIFGDPDDPTNSTFYSDTSYMRAADSMAVVFTDSDISMLESFLTELQSVPFAENDETFEPLEKPIDIGGTAGSLKVVGKGKTVFEFVSGELISGSKKMGGKGLKSVP